MDWNRLSDSLRLDIQKQFTKQLAVAQAKQLTFALISRHSIPAGLVTQQLGAMKIIDDALSAGSVGLVTFGCSLSELYGEEPYQLL